MASSFSQLPVLGSGGGSGSGVADAKKIRLEIFESISSTTGTVTKPTNSTILLNQFGGTTDAVLAKISGGKPIQENVVNGSGVILATSFNASGDYVLTGTPSAYPVAICYVVEVALEDYDDTNPNILSTYYYSGLSATSIGDGSVSDAEFKEIPNKEDGANKATDFTVINDTKYPTTEAVRELTAAYEGTGILTGGVISIGTGGAGVATTFTIAAGTGQVVNNTVSPSTVTKVTWSQKTDVAITNLATNAVSYIAIDSAGNVQQSTTPWTPAQKRQYIEIGLVSHPNLTNVSAVNQNQCVAYNPINQLEDLMQSIGFFNISGNIYSANGANLKLNKSAGFVFNHGGNYSSLTDNPHVITTTGLTQAQFRMVNQSGAAGALITDIDVTNYDVGGVTTAMTVNRFTIHRIFLFNSNLTAIQRGQNQYLSLAEAKAAIQVENFVINPGLTNALLRAYLIVKRGTTSLQSATDAFLLEAPKFGGSAGVGGLSVSTLQNTYDNSSDPEVTTDSTRGALSIKRGSAADTDSVFEVKNGAGTTKASIDGNGALTAAEVKDPSGNVMVNLATSVINTVTGNPAIYLDNPDYPEVSTAPENSNANEIASTNYADRAANAALTSANSYTDTGLSSKENTSNKATDFTTINDTKFPTTEAVAEFVQEIQINTQVASYILALSDKGKLVRMNVGSANNLTVPPNADVAFPVGTQILFSQAGSGQTTVQPGTGVTLNAANGGLKTMYQHSVGGIVKIDTNTWLVFGDLSS